MFTRAPGRFVGFFPLCWRVHRGGVPKKRRYIGQDGRHLVEKRARRRARGNNRGTGVAGRRFSPCPVVGGHTVSSVRRVAARYGGTYSYYYLGRPRRRRGGLGRRRPLIIKWLRNRSAIRGRVHGCGQLPHRASRNRRGRVMARILYYYHGNVFRCPWS